MRNCNGCIMFRTVIDASSRSLRVCDSVGDCSKVVCDLDVFFDSEMCMKHHVGKTASACFYHIRRLCQIRHLVSREVLAQLVTLLMLSRLDYCNAVLAGLPASMLAPLQHAQNAAARLALGLDRRSHITTALQKLHWLLLKYRVTFNIATIMHQTFHHRCPSYLSDLVVFASAGSNVRQLRSSTTRAAAVR